MIPNSGQTGTHKKQVKYRWLPPIPLLCVGTSSSFNHWNICKIKVYRSCSVCQIRPRSLIADCCGMDSMFPQQSSAFIPFHSHTVLLSRCQSQQANSPKALSGWNSLEKARLVLVQPAFIQNPMWDIPWGGERLISRAKTMSSDPAGSEEEKEEEKKEEEGGW